MILLIDNYDSFSYNLFQLVGTITPDIKVIRNDEIKPEDIEKINPDGIIISPGPGKPSDAGICEDVIRMYAGRIPILGVCLGHHEHDVGHAIDDPVVIGVAGGMCGTHLVAVRFETATCPFEDEGVGELILTTRVGGTCLTGVPDAAVRTSSLLAGVGESHL